MASCSATSGVMPTFKTVSIMPGIENFAPERTERISGLSGLPNSLSSSFSSADIAASNSAGSVAGEWPLFKNS